MKKITAILLVALFALAMIAPVSAEGISFSLEADPAEVNPGETVDIALEMENNPGLKSYSWSILFNEDAFGVADPEEDFTDNIKAKNGGAAIGMSATKFDVPGKVAFNFATGTAKTGNGTVAIVTFTVDANAAAGDYTFTLKGYQSNKADEAELATCTVKVLGAAEPEVEMSASTKDNSEVAANFIVDLPAGEDPADYTVSINGAANTLPADGKVSVAVPVKKMGAQITVQIRDASDSVVYEATTSVKDYCEAIIANADNAFTDQQVAAAESMLGYGSAAQVYFGETEDLINAPAVTTPVAAERFDTDPFASALAAANAPVEYAALNVAFVEDCTLFIALKVTSGDAAAAGDWVAANITLDGEAPSIIVKDGFVIIRKDGITIDKVNADIALAVDGAAAGVVSVADYLRAVENAYANATDDEKVAFLGLARALYAYALAVEAL